MLSVRELVKIYNAKDGVPVRALDGVTLDFPEKGMVFLLGRSGSGKSTLLNIAGGLDAPDSGEIVVKDRSSKGFSRDDFDSYRNTFVGFVFQEYNILEEFSVAENVALALELQGRPADAAAVDAILDKVDLRGLGRRMPNTLSGGQKQRVAIARALVKDPEILMADEPTGALDSNTGRQVLETLHALSREKLVIVVSHDREFAEQYGDRIIELADGRVISDVEKTRSEPTALSEHITRVGENTVSVPQGTALSEEELRTLAQFISESPERVLITRDGRDIDTFRRAAHMSEDGARECFAPTGEVRARSYTPEESRFIRSRLPLRHAMRIGASSLRVKRFRLCMTVFLSTCAFVMFGLLSTMMGYRESAAMASGFANADFTAFRASKDYRVRYTGENYTYDGYKDARLSPADLAELARTGGAAALPAYGFGYCETVPLEELVEKGEGFYHFPYVSGIAVSEEKTLAAAGLTLAAGRFPQTAEEICISSELADAFCAFGYSEGDTVHPIRAPREMLSRRVHIEGMELTVVGILATPARDARYDELKSIVDPIEVYSDDRLYGLHRALATRYVEGYGSLIFVSEKFMGVYRERIHPAGGSDLSWEDSPFTQSDSAVMEFTNWSATLNFAKRADLDAMLTGGQPVPGRGECLLTVSVLAQAAQNLLWDENTPQWQDAALMEASNALCNNGEVLTQEQYAQYLATVTDALDATFTGERDWHTLTLRLPGEETRTYTVVGILPERYFTGIVIPDGEYDELREASRGYRIVRKTNYTASPDEEYDFALLPASADTSALIAMHLADPRADDTVLRLGNEIVTDVQEISELVEIFRTVFLWAGCILALFAALLLFNFVSLSINAKRREIGILRAVGARGMDVFRIFFCESAIIAVICWVLASIGTLLVAGLLNSIVMADVGLGFELMIFGPLQIATVFGIAAAVAVVATWFPVWLAARKRPVEAIRAL